jgi:hypothetical protein
VFNNCFQTLAGTDLFAPAADELFLRIVSAIKEVAPVSSVLLEPILRHPTGPVHFLAVDYIASARQGRLVERPELDRSVRVRAEDIAKLDDYMGSTFLESALSFQFLHLKSINARILSLDHEINPAPFLVLLRESETQGGTTLRLGGMQIPNTGAERIRQFVSRKGGRLIERCSIQLRIHDLIDQLDEFTSCEIHVVMPINSPRLLTYIATEEEFVLMEDYQPITDVADEDPEEIARRGYGRSYRMKLAEQANESYHMLIDYLQQSSFIRSRQCRQKVSTYFLALLAQWEEEFYNQMTTWKELHHPKKVEERSRADMTRLFRRALWQTDESNPIGEVIQTCSAMAEFERFCSVSPVASGAYEPPTLTPELNDELALVFAQNAFFRKSGIALRGDEIL